HRRRAGHRPIGVEHGLRRARPRPAVPRQARVPSEIRRRRGGDGPRRPAGTRGRRAQHGGPGTGTSTRRHADHGVQAVPRGRRLPSEVAGGHLLYPPAGFWSISAGTYSSRFGALGTSAVALAARKLRQKLVAYAAHLMDRSAAELEFRDGGVRTRDGAGLEYSVKDLAGPAPWNTASLPAGMEPGLEATAVFGFPGADPVDERDRVNASSTYGFIAEVMAVEVDHDTAAIRILSYASVHDAGTIVNPMIAEGQICGGALHGLGGALGEELQYD